MRRYVAPLLAAMLPAMAKAGPEMYSVTYTCERGVALPVVFINPADGPSLAVLSAEGKLVPMRSRPAGSGARYIALDEQDSYRLYTKGDTAILSHLAADHTVREETLLSDCRIGK